MCRQRGARSGRKVSIRAVKLERVTYHSTVFEGKVLGELVADVAWELVVAGKGTVVRGSSRELDVGAKLYRSACK